MATTSKLSQFATVTPEAGDKVPIVRAGVNKNVNVEDIPAMAPPAWGGIDGLLANQTDLQDALDALASVPFSVTVALSDLSTDIVSGASVVGFWTADFDGALTDVMTALGIAQSSSGAVTVDVKLNGTSVFTTKPSIDASEDSSLTGTAAVLTSDPDPLDFVAGDVFTFLIDAAGTGSKGLQATLKGTRA